MGNIEISNNDEPTMEIKVDSSDINHVIQSVAQSEEIRDFYSKYQDANLEALSYYEDDIMEKVDVLTRKIQTWDSETVKGVPADELEQTFLCLYDNLYILIQNVHPLWQVGMERIKLLKDYQDLYVEMLKVRGEL